MMIIIRICSSLWLMACLVISAVSAVFSSTAQSVSHQFNLNCGECIYHGYNSCLKSRDHPILNENEDYDPNDGGRSLCFAPDSSTTRYTDTAWICSNNYNNTLYSYFMCPQKVAQCGTVGTTEMLEIKQVKD